VEVVVESTNVESTDVVEFTDVSGSSGGTLSLLEHEVTIAGHVSRHSCSKRHESDETGNRCRRYKFQSAGQFHLQQAWCTRDRVSRSLGHIHRK